MKNRLDKLPANTLISDVKISSKNKKYIEDFLEHIKNKVTDVRLRKYRYALTRFADLVEKDFDKLTFIEVEEASAIINNKSELSNKTKEDLVAEVRTAFKYLFGEGYTLPKAITALKPPKQKQRLRLPEKMPTEEEIYAMIKACSTSRDKFFIALLGLDGALRPIEARRLTWGCVKKDQHGYFILFETAKKSGDKDKRVVRLIKSEPYFIQWNKEYPLQRKDNNYIFINFDDYKQLTQGAISALFTRLKKKLNMPRMYPYLLRHQLITRMSKDPNISIPVLKKFIGHSGASNTISEYQHFGDEDTKDMQLQFNGLTKKKEKKEINTKPIKCPKCKQPNEYDAEFCNFCNTALTQKRMLEIIEMTDKNNKLIGEIFESKLKELGLLKKN